MHIITSDKFLVDLHEKHRFPMDKYSILESIVVGKLGKKINLSRAQLADIKLLQLAHSDQYVEKVLTGNLTRIELQKIGFPWSDNLILRARMSVGATIAALSWAKKESVSVSLAGGTHHAKYAEASGFCLFNDVAIATIHQLRADNEARVLVVDCDVHQGDGTAEILENYDRAYTFSIHSARNYPHQKVFGNYDIELSDGTGDVEYLEKLSEGLLRAITKFSPSIIFFNAGVDVHAKDRLGRLKLTTEGLRNRDAVVFELARSCSASVVAVMGGGYGDSAIQIADLHYQTVEQAYNSWRLINYQDTSSNESSGQLS